MSAERILAQLRPGLSPTSLALLERLLAGAEQIEDDTCVFPGEDGDSDEDRRLVIAKEPARMIPPEAPPALAKFLAVCAGMECGESGNTGALLLHDGTGGTLHTVGEDAMNEKACGFPYDGDLCSPIDVNLQSFYLFDPDGHLLYHDSEGTTEPAWSDDPVEVYLRELMARFRIVG